MIDNDLTNITNNILAERARQDKLWGEQNHDPFTWLAILGEEVGEANTAAADVFFGGKSTAHYREELTHVAAVAISMIECLDRGTWPKEDFLRRGRNAFNSGDTPKNKEGTERGQAGDAPSGANFYNPLGMM